MTTQGAAVHGDDQGAGQGVRGRTALVTGGAGGLGRAVTGALLRAGARVHVPTFDEAEEEALARYLGDGVAAVTLHPGVDLTDPGQVEALAEALPRVDILFNLAGGFAMGPVHETAPEGWQRMMEMNASTAFLVTRALLPGMRQGRFGRIVNVSALPALEGGAAGMGAYGASKAAVLHLTRVVAREGREHGITCNAILPEIIDTPGNREAMPDADTGGWLDPEDIARVLLFLASDEARIVNGAALPLLQPGTAGGG
jgi:NAD(P)-dependent dehydrogenase (short-subunit alcohol dehydrogenase family)